jgi:isochorismate hydrolase
MRLFWSKVLSPSDPLAALDIRLPVLKEDIVIRKPSYSLFSKRAVKAVLKQTVTEQVVICGVMTDLCCDTAAREAFLNGYTPFVVADATASTTEDLHLSALKTAAHGYALIVLTESLL